MFLAGLLTVGSTAAAYAQQATTPLRTADPQVGDMPSGAAFLKDSFEAIAELAVWRRASAETAALGETGRCVALLMQRREANRAGKNHEKTMLAKVNQDEVADTRSLLGALGNAEVADKRYQHIALPLA